MEVEMFKLLVPTFLALSSSITPAFAQNPQAQEMFNLFSGMMQTAITQEATAEWRKLPDNEIVCLDQALHAQGSSVQVAIQRGIGPADPRIAEDRAKCRGQTASDNAPSDNAPNAIYYVANTKPPDAFLALRTDPDSGLQIMAMPNGTELQVLQRRDDGWWYVRVLPSGQEGWALSGQNSNTWIECCLTASANQLPEAAQPPVPQTPNQPTQSYVAAPTSLDQNAAAQRYLIQGVHLGDDITKSTIYGNFTCSPSDVFQSFTWCVWRQDGDGPNGNFINTTSALHSSDGRVYYMSRTIDPAVFGPNDINQEIDRLSRHYGQRPNVLTMPAKAGVPSGIIVSWGNIVLQPLDIDSVQMLGAGKNPHKGYLVDFLGDFKRSAQRGLPIYLLAGGAGMLWGATYDDAGQGRLRIAFVDASKFMDVSTPEVANQSANPTTKTLNINPIATPSDQDSTDSSDAEKGPKEISENAQAAATEALQSALTASATENTAPAENSESQVAPTLATEGDDDFRKDLPTIMLWIALGTFLAVIVLGAMHKYVIYMDTSDLGMNVLPTPVAVAGVLVAVTMQSQPLQTVIIISTAAIVIGIIVYNFAQSLRFNAFAPIVVNLTIALVKTIFSFAAFLLSLLLLFSFLGADTRRQRINSAIFLALLAFLTERIVNGSSVYQKRRLLFDQHA